MQNEWTTEWTSKQNATSKWISRNDVDRKINVNKPVFLSLFLLVFIIVLFFPIWSHSPPPHPKPQPQPALPVQYWDSLGRNKFVCVAVCLSCCFFLSLFVFIHISSLWPFSSVSLTLVIFCLVAPNMPHCLSAVATQVIYIYAGSDNR